MSEQDKKYRPIKSYVLRTGRMTPGQERAFDRLWPQFGIDFNGQPLEFAQLFGNSNPVFIEIGFGNGESLAQMAAAAPENNYLGIEVHRPGVGHLLLKIEELKLKNLRVIQHDAVEVLTQGVADATLAGLFLFFPDPWHKKRHHKRRILKPSFVSLLERVIRPGGFFHAATDWEPYAEQMLEVMSAADNTFDNSAGKGAFTPRPTYRPLTKFEQRGHRLGHGVWDLIFLRQ
ncbi:MAG: tRNA (guanosine(46)-N7)-methyltransferase TrmB [Candidatus Sedimenticola sp. (ex Thyasira tokunagai)]